MFEFNSALWYEFQLGFARPFYRRVSQTCRCVAVVHGHCLLLSLLETHVDGIRGYLLICPVLMSENSGYPGSYVQLIICNCCICVQGTLMVYTFLSFLFFKKALKSILKCGKTSKLAFPMHKLRILLESVWVIMVLEGLLGETLVMCRRSNQSRMWTSFGPLALLWNSFILVANEY